MLTSRRYFACRGKRARRTAKYRRLTRFTRLHACPFTRVDVFVGTTPLLHCITRGVHIIAALHRKGRASWPLHCCTALKRACKLATPCCTASTRGVHIIAALHRKGRASWPLHCCTALKRACKLATPCCTASTRGVHIIAELHRNGRASWPLYCCTVFRTRKLSGSKAFIGTQSCIDMRLHSQEFFLVNMDHIYVHYEIDLLELKKTCDVLYLEKNSCTITHH